MIRGGRIIINRSTAFVMLAFITLFEGNYWALFSILVGPASLRYLVWLGVIVLCVFDARGKFYRSPIIMPWIIYFVLVLFRNQELATGGFINTYRIVLCLLTLIMEIQNVEWTLSFPKLLTVVCLPNALTTILFYFNNDIYEQFVRATYGVYQSGTANGMYGYRAGIADHYSQNGTYITMIILVLASILLVKAVSPKRRKYIFGVLAFAVCALILTEKRAHLLFSVATLLVVYMIGNSDRISRKVFKLLIALIVVLTLGGIFIDQIPILQSVLRRFESATTDTNVTKRFFMWNLAKSQFWKNPIIGNGFFGFMFNASNTNIIIDASAGCHNMYIQLLSECGVIGLGVLLACIISSVCITVKNVKYIFLNSSFEEYRSTIASALAIQVFTIMYGLTGNPIYDRTFNFYILAVAINIALYIRISHERNTGLK